MKKVILLLLLLTHSAYAIRPLPVASDRFQKSLSNYLLPKNKNNPVFAQAVVAEYDSPENTEKYKRVFDNMLYVKGLTIGQLRSAGTTKSHAVAPEKAFEQSASYAIPAYNSAKSGAQTIAAPNGAAQAIQTTHVQLQQLQKEADGAVKGNVMPTVEQEEAIPEASASYKIPAHNSAKSGAQTIATPNSATQAVQTTHVQLQQLQKYYDQELAQAQSEWQTWNTQQRKDFANNLQAQSKRVDVLLENSQSTQAQKDAQTFTQSIADNLKTASDNISSTAQVEFTAINQEDAAVKDNVIQELGFDQSPVSQEEMQQLDQQSQSAAQDADPAVVEAMQDLIEAEDDEALSDDPELAEDKQNLDSVTIIIENDQNEAENLEGTIFEKVEELSTIDNAANIVTQETDKIGMAGGGAMSAVALKSVLSALAAVEENSAEVKTLTDKFRNNPASFTADIGAQLVLALNKAAQDLAQKINALKAQLFDKLIIVDQETIKLLQIEQDLKKKIAANKKNSIATLNRALDTKITAAIQQFCAIKQALAKIDSHVKRIIKTNLKNAGFTGKVIMDAQVQAYYDKLSVDKNLLENRIAGLTKLRQTRGKRMPALEALDTKMQKYIDNNSKLVAQLQESIAQRQAAQAALAQNKLLRVTQRTVDESIKKLQQVGGDIAHTFAESAQKTATGAAKVYRRASRLSRASMHAIADAMPVVIDFMASIRNDIKQASGKSVNELSRLVNQLSTRTTYPTVSSPRAPQGSKVPTGLSQQWVKTQQALADKANASIRAAQNRVDQAKKVVKDYALEAKEILKEGSSKDAATIKQLAQKAQQASEDLAQKTQELAKTVSQAAQERLQQMYQSTRQATQPLSERASKALTSFANTILGSLKRGPK